uniref:Uncharacterized protein n=1 Tax=Arcella intermedia TaxID=1963864 RepID=A0A6B2LI75_9EUKA
MFKQNKKSIQKSTRLLDRELRALELQEQKVQKEIQRLAKSGQTSAVRIMAKEIVSIRKQKEHLLKTKVTLGAVASKTTTARATMAVQTAFAGATKAMATANAINSPEKIQQTMLNFEKQNQMMQLQEEMLDELLEDSEEEEEAQELVDTVLEDIGIELNRQMVPAPKNKLSNPTIKAKTPQNEDAELEALLKSL